MSEPRPTSFPEAVTVERLAGAMAALGMYRGGNTPAEHAGEAAKFGGAEAYRVWMANALLGMVQTEAMLADGVDLPDAARRAAWEQQLASAGAGGEDLANRIGFVRWQVLRASAPLRVIARDGGAGPAHMAATHAATGLQVLLDVTAAGQRTTAADVETLVAQLPRLREARDCLRTAIADTDDLLDMLELLETPGP